MMCLLHNCAWYIYIHTPHLHTHIYTHLYTNTVNRWMHESISRTKRPARCACQVLGPEYSRKSAVEWYEKYKDDFCPLKDSWRCYENGSTWFSFLLVWYSKSSFPYFTMLQGSTRSQLPVLVQEHVAARGGDRVFCKTQYRICHLISLVVWDRVFAMLLLFIEHTWTVWTMNNAFLAHVQLAVTTYPSTKKSP